MTDERCNGQVYYADTPVNRAVEGCLSCLFFRKADAGKNLWRCLEAVTVFMFCYVDRPLRFILNFGCFRQMQ